MARTTQIKVTGNVTEALAALDHLGLKAETVAKETEGHFEGAAKGVGGAFGKLGNLGGQFGIPFSESLSKIGEKLSDTEGKSRKFGAALAEAGKLALTAGAAGFAVVGAEGLKLATNYQQATAKISASAGISVKAANEIGNAFLKTGFQSTFSAQEMADAYGQVAGQLGATEGKALSTAQATQVMKAATDLAEASGSDLNTTTAALAATMQAYGLKVADAASAGDVLFNTSRMTGNGVDQVSTAVNRLRMRLGSATPPLDQVGGLMVEFAQHGVTGSRSVNMVASSLSGLVFPSTTAQKALGEMGVKLRDAHGKFIGLGPAIDELRKGFEQLPGASQAAAAAAELVSNKNDLARLSLEKQTPEVKKNVAALKQQDVRLQIQAQSLSQSSVAQQIFGSNAATLMPIIMAGSDALAKNTDKVRENGAAQDAAEKQANTFKGETEKLKAGLEDLGVRVGQWLIPKLDDLAHMTEKVIGWFDKHKTAAKALAITVTTVLGAAVAAFTINKLAGLASGIGKAITNVEKMGGTLQKLATRFLGVGTAAGTMATETEAANAKAVASTEAADSEIAAANEGAAVSGAGRAGGAGVIPVGRAGAGAAAGEAESVATAEGAVATEGEAAAAGMTGMGVAAGSAVPIIGALAVGVGVLGKTIADHLDSATSGAIDYIHSLGSSTDSLTTAMVNNTAQSGKIEDAWVRAQIQASGLDQKAAASGITVDRLAFAIEHGSGATQQLIQSWEATGNPSSQTIIRLIALANNYDGATQKVQGLINKQGEIKPIVNSKVLVDISGAMHNLSLIGSQFQQLQNGVSARVNIGVGGSRQGTAYATGGWVTGAGTHTSDSVNARLSNGEYVLSDAMLTGNAPVDPRVRQAITGGAGGGSGATVHVGGVQIVAQTNASATGIANELNWALRPYMAGA